MNPLPDDEDDNAHADPDADVPGDFFRNLKRMEAGRRASVDPAALEGAFLVLTRTLQAHWSTHGGTHLRRFVWSLWNGEHHVNLYRTSGAWDAPITEAVILVFAASFSGLVPEERLRRLLEESGEMVRWDQARADTPDDAAVDYPPLPRDVRERVAKLEPLPPAEW